MLRKALLALATATALAAAVPAQANHTLAHKVALLTAKLNCLQKYPVYSFGDYAYAEINSDLADQGATQIEVLIPNVLPVNALDFDYGTTQSPAERRVPARRQADLGVHGEVRDGPESGVRRARSPREDGTPAVVR